MRRNPSWTYRKSGVDLDQIRNLHNSVERVFSSTFKERAGKIGEVICGVGHYAGLIKIGNRVLALHTDGVGSKVIIAQEMRKFSTIGIDCIAMNVNDIVCMGAEPLAAVDYIALRQPNNKLVEEISKGLVEGAKQASISIVGGETAILPDIIRGAGKNAFDLSASCIGIADEDKTILDRKMNAGDIIIGLMSSGIHSNGLTLARRVLKQRHTLREKVFDSKDSLGETLLTPTRIYSRSVFQALQNSEAISGLAHITGGAFTKLSRLTRGRNLGFDLEDLPRPHPIFDLIQKEGRIKRSEMYRTFNMGIGFCVICRPSAVSRISDSFDQDGINAYRIGKVVPVRGVFLDGKRI